MKKLILFFLLLFNSLLGVAKASNDLSSDAEMRRLLSLSLAELMQVEIETAGKVAEKLGEIPASVVLITRREIQHYGYTTLNDILQHVSGVYHIDFYGLGGPAYGVRGYLSTGSANRNIIILVNGVSQVSDYDSSYFITGTPVPVEAIDRIEIVRGPQSTIYGSGAFFGVINIITNEVTQEKGAASYVSLLGGSRQVRRWFGRTSYVYEKGQVVLNVGTHQDDGFDIPYDQLESKPMVAEAGFTTGGRMESAQKYFGLSGNYENISFDITHNNSDTEGFISRPVIGDGSIKEIESTHLRIGYQKDLSKQLSLDGKLTYIHNISHLVYDSPFIADTFNFQDENSTAYEGEVTLQWKLPEHFDLLSGIYYRHAPKVSTYIDLPGLPTVTSLHKATQRLQSGDALVNRALFTQLNYYPDERWKWVVGLRLEQVLGYGAFAEYGKNPSEYKSLTPYYDDQDLAIIPRVAAIYTPNDKHIFKLIYGKAINSPSFAQNTSTRLDGTLPPLEAEKIETYEFDYITYLSPNYMLNANLFHNRLEKLFERTMIVTSTNQLISFLGNGSEWTTNGLELSLQAQPTDKTELELSITYQKTKDENRPDVEAAYSPKLLGQLKLGYQWTSQLSVGLTSYYVSEMEVFFDPTLQNPDGSFGKRINGTASKGYLMTGANIRFQDWLTKGTFVNLRVNNIFDQEVTYPTYMRNLWIDRGSMGEERNFMLTVGYEF